MRKLCAMLAALAALLLAGCQEGKYVDPAFVGTWHWVDNVTWTYVFNDDGYGQRGDDRQFQMFSWGTRDGMLVLDHGPGFRNSELVYAFMGNMLNLSDHTGYFYYIRFVPDPGLVDTWVSFAYNFIEKTKNADGTGFLMPFLGKPDERVDFRWFVTENLLIHHMGPSLQVEWAYSLDEDALALVGGEGTGETQEFTRGSLSQVSALMGTWVWDRDYEWEYYFGQNAEGSRGRAGHETQIIWTTLNDNLIIIDLGTYIVESWRFMIAGSILHLSDTGGAGIAYRYARR